MKENSKKKLKTINKNRIYFIVGITFFIVGLALVLFPVISKAINNLYSHSIVNDFKDRLESISQISSTESVIPSTTNDDASEPESDQSQNTEGNSSSYTLSEETLQRLYDDLTAYNNDLIENGQRIADPFAYERPSFDLSKYGINDLLFGYIEIPAINLSLPVYLGANSNTMYYGVGHISMTSIPLGGESTHSVIAGHRGMIGKEMFDNIVYLTEGDDIYFTSYWGTLHYKVCETMIIDPLDTEKIKIQKGRDLLSILTCHPYGYSTYRYVVVSERVIEN